MKTPSNRIFLDCLKRNRFVFPVFLLIFALEALIFSLYSLPAEPLLYALLLSFLLCVFIFVCSFLRSLRRQKEFDRAKKSVPNDTDAIPLPENLSEEQYVEIIALLSQELNRLNLRLSEERSGMQDYYTAWVHNIKTPIAVLKLRIGDGMPELRSELFRIEQYADMALNYIRIESETNDLLPCECKLDQIICDSVRKFAPQFISKKLRMKYESTDCTVVTDRKWLGFIIDQLLSNAVKYTDSGFVEITYSQETSTLYVKDSGIGIPACDLPRIFEKGFTGSNGRAESKSTGFGLYMCKKACGMLGIRIAATSEPGLGTEFSLIFPKR